MSKKSLPEDEVRSLAKKIAKNALDEIMRRPGGGQPEEPGYQCDQQRFECLGEYDCIRPDDCFNEFSCPKKYTEPT